MDCFSPVYERMKTNGNSLDILLLQELAIMQHFSSALLQLSFNNLEADNDIYYEVVIRNVFECCQHFLQITAFRSP